VVTGTVADLFFVHERGFYTGVWILCQLGPSNLSPVIAAFIIRRLGWRWTFWFLAIFSGIAILMLIALCPETHYIRKNVLEPHEAIGTDKKIVLEVEEFENVPELSPFTTSKWSRFRIWPKHLLSNESFLIALGRPLSLLLCPTILWAGFCYAFTVVWAVVLNVSLAQLFSAPPYKFGTIALGLTNLCPFVWVLIASSIAGRMSDFIAVYLSRRNNGVYEPEFRLYAIVPYLILGTMGFVGFGLSIAAADMWFGPVFFFGMVSSASIFGNVAFMAYVVDSHTGVASESLIVFGIVKSVVAYAFLWFINDWIAVQGVKNTFSVLGGLNTFIALTTVPMYIYGKRVREWIQLHPTLSKIAGNQKHIQVSSGESP